ncbi:polyprenyl synthetase family protein [Candidatus Nanosalina sp. VS9-1]|uniref:polyprenyl synthetase family protein n=1 Tax=Candidatus Nanosalina sp. VS9-1 TaxID=3388566 RepID=UPI0039DF6CCD
MNPQESDNVLKHIQSDKKKVSNFLDNYLDEWEEMEPDASRWRSDIKGRMKEMAKGGKMVRGALVLKTNNFYDGKNTDEAVKVAGAIELLHTGLLMHDDIIDKDDYRRGMPTFAKQYQELGEDEDLDNVEHFGAGMAIAGGDIAYFMGQGLLADLDIKPEKRRKITELVFSEFSAVGLAEQVDIYSGYSKEEIDEEEIMRLYRDKTARYTFSLPFKAGALMAEASEDEIERLYRLGERIGIIFQLRDDELSLFGDEAETGKSLGSDLEENKKTLHRLKMLEKLPEDERESMREKLRKDLDHEEKAEIIEKMNELEVQKEVQEKMSELAEEAYSDIENLEAPEDFKDFLRKLTDFCLERRK